MSSHQVVRKEIITVITVAFLIRNKHVHNKLLANIGKALKNFTASPKRKGHCFVGVEEDEGHWLGHGGKRECLQGAPCELQIGRAHV